MKPVQYQLEIYEPGSWHDCWMQFSASSPFQAIAVGDLVNPSTWPNSQSPRRVLRVTSIEHIIWEGEGQPKHKVCVYTEEVDNTEELRFGKKRA